MKPSARIPLAKRERHHLKNHRRMLVNTSVRSAMSTPVITGNTTNTLTQLRALMQQESINHLPIVDEAMLPVGMVSSLDLNQMSNWRTRFKELAPDGERIDEKLFGSLLAEEIMIQPVLSISQDATVQEAAKLIEQHHIHCLPVTDKAGKLVGILTAHDLLRLAYGS
jgi:CBS domain-containing protein